MNLARWLMTLPLFVLIYERLWRPTAFFLVSGRTLRADLADAERTLDLEHTRTLLDIACGPGNFTSYLRGGLGPDGHAVGLDLSAPMLRQAHTDNTGPGISYVRADAERLPFPDSSFDSVCCFGALYLIPDPMTAVQEMIRVLAPGGHLSISTSYLPESWFGRLIAAFFARVLGVRFFDIAVFPKLFVEAGLVDIDQQTHGLLQYLNATRPA